MFNILKTLLVNQAVKSAEYNYDSENRSNMLKTGKRAFSDGELAHALNYFTLAASPRAGYNSMSDGQIQTEAENLTEEVRNKIANVQMHKQSLNAN